MNAWIVDGVLHIHSEIHHVDEHLQNAVDNGRSARCAQHQFELAAARHDGRSHRRERAFARLNGVGFALHQAKAVGLAGLGGEIVHLVVEQEAKSGDGHAIAISEVQRVGDRHRIAVRVYDRVVRGLAAFRTRRLARVKLRTGRGVLRIDRFSQLRNVRRVQQGGQRHLHEVRISHGRGPIGEIAAHGFRQVMQFGGRPRSGLFVSRAFQHAQHLQDAGSAGAGRRRCDNVVAAISSGERRTFHDCVIFQIGQRDKAAVALHIRGQQARRLAFIKIARALLPDAPERARHFGLHERLAGFV